jgi:hypothetical protein
LLPRRSHFERKAQFDRLARWDFQRSGKMAVMKQDDAEDSVEAGSETLGAKMQP